MGIGIQLVFGKQWTFLFDGEWPVVWDLLGTPLSVEKSRKEHVEKVHVKAI